MTHVGYGACGRLVAQPCGSVRAASMRLLHSRHRERRVHTSPPDAKQAGGYRGRFRRDPAAHSRGRRTTPFVARRSHWSRLPWRQSSRGIGAGHAGPLHRYRRHSARRRRGLAFGDTWTHEPEVGYGHGRWKDAALASGVGYRSRCREALPFWSDPCSTDRCADRPWPGSSADVECGRRR